MFISHVIRAEEHALIKRSSFDLRYYYHHRYVYEINSSLVEVGYKM